jgi:hypothetical protein
MIFLAADERRSLLIFAVLLLGQNSENQPYQRSSAAKKKVSMNKCSMGLLNQPDLTALFFFFTLLICNVLRKQTSPQNCM